MNYIVHTRFKGMALCGEVNLPAFTPAECRDGTIWCGDKPICYKDSENDHQHFSRDDDGSGMLRGRLTQAIQKELAKPGDGHQARWDKVWADPLCQPYKRPEDKDYWLWNDRFFEADIGVLRHIAKLVGAKGVE